MFHFPSVAGAEVRERACPACGGFANEPRFEKDTFRYVACSQCGMVYINPIPVEDTLEESYDRLSEDYFLDARRRAIDEYPERHARELELLIRARAAGRLLDVGCATGSFLRAAGRVGIKVAQGIDIAGPSIEVAKRLGLDVRSGHFTDGVFDDSSFDVVTMWNTLEHLPGPFAFVREALRVLTPGGVLAISVPNYNSLSVLLLGKRYRYIGLAHLNYFSPRTLSAMLERGGFEVQYVETRSFNPYVVLQDCRGAPTGTNEMIRETELSKSFKSQGAFAPLRLLYNVVDKLLRAAGRGDSLLVIARKP